MNTDFENKNAKHGRASSVSPPNSVSGLVPPDINGRKCHGGASSSLHIEQQYKASEIMRMLYTVYIKED